MPWKSETWVDISLFYLQEEQRSKVWGGNADSERERVCGKRSENELGLRWEIRVKWRGGKKKLGKKWIRYPSVLVNSLLLHLPRLA